VVEATVVAVSVAVTADVLEMERDVGERLHVAELLALVGPLTEHERSIVPVNELAGVTVMLEVLPDVAPGLMERLLGLLEREKLVPVLGACQKSPHPARKGRTIRNSPAHLERLIVAPIPAPVGAGFQSRTHTCRLLWFICRLPWSVSGPIGCSRCILSDERLSYSQHKGIARQSFVSR
jgi:hypothetical protein